MTTTKFFTLLAAIVPFGFVVLAAVALTHILYQRRQAGALAAGTRHFVAY